MGFSDKTQGHRLILDTESILNLLPFLWVIEFNSSVRLKLPPEQPVVLHIQQGRVQTVHR